MFYCGAEKTRSQECSFVANDNNNDFSTTRTMRTALATAPDAFTVSRALRVVNVQGTCTHPLTCAAHSHYRVHRHSGIGLGSRERHSRLTYRGVRDLRGSLNTHAARRGHSKQTLRGATHHSHYIAWQPVLIHSSTRVETNSVTQPWL